MPLFILLYSAVGVVLLADPQCLGMRIGRGDLLLDGSDFTGVVAACSDGSTLVGVFVLCSAVVMVSVHALILSRRG